MKCWFCKSELVWQNDMDAKDYFNDGNKEGIVTTLLCGNEECGAVFEGFILEEGKEADDKM